MIGGPSGIAVAPALKGPAPQPLPGEHAAPGTLLDVAGLTVRFPVEGGTFTAVSNLDLAVAEHETVAIVGESGSGKSVTALAITRLLDFTVGRIEAGAVRFRDHAGTVRDLAAASQETMRRLRGPEIAMVFQEPMTSLNPVLRVGTQISEAMELHRGLGHAAAMAEARRMLELVRIPDASRQLARYPFELSGGMRQRVMIAMALSCRPHLLIADEPTTALDVTVQAQVLRLMRLLQAELGMAVLFITHDMGVVAEIADRVVVMRRSEKVEEGDATTLFDAPRHPYTRALLAAVPSLGSLSHTPLPLPFASADPAAPAPAPQATVRDDAAPVLTVDGLTTRFTVRRGIFGRAVGRVHAVEHVSFTIKPGETLGLVGESGCGKSTTGRSIIRLEEPESGRVLVEGVDVSAPDAKREALLHRAVQYIFQDPFASLDPRLTVGFSIAEPITTYHLAAGRDIANRVRSLLQQVEMAPEYISRYPHELSGGQRQRICIARALACEPRLIIADECTAALDVSVRARVVNLMMELQARYGLAYLFISHDMAVIERVAHRIVVMYLGQIVEMGPRQAVMNDPQHPYTRRLLAAVPVADPRRRGHDRDLDDSEIPSPLRALDDPPTVAPLVEVGPDHFVARHHVGGLY